MAKGNTNGDGKVKGTSLQEVAIAKATPPPRRRSTTQVLSDDLLASLRDNIDAENWLTNGVLYDGQDGESKDASNAARIYRRDLSRFLAIEERGIRTRVWEAEEGKFAFAVRLRDPLPA